MNQIEKRSILLAVVLSIVTCALYCLYWVYKVTNEAHAAAGRKTTASGGMVLLYSFITFGIYTFYWFYKMGETVNEAKDRYGIPHDSNGPILYPILSVFGLGIVSLALIQDGLNQIAEASGSL